MLPEPPRDASIPVFVMHFPVAGSQVMPMSQLTPVHRLTQPYPAPASCPALVLEGGTQTCPGGQTTPEQYG